MANHYAPNKSCAQLLHEEQATGRRTPKKRSNLLSNILIVLGVVLLLVAAGMWGFAQWRYHEQDVINQKLAGYSKVEKEDGPPTVDWEGLKAINPDVVGWIYVPGTTINYPVYQGEDNDRYLRHNAEGEWTIGGQIFLDYESRAPGMIDHQSIIYGHHLNDGSMFEQIAALDDQKKFDEITTIWYITEEQAIELQPLLLYYTHPEDQNVRIFSFENIAKFHDYLEELLAKSQTHAADADKIIHGTKNVLALATCNYLDGYGRTIFLCVPKIDAENALGNQEQVLAEEEATRNAATQAQVEADAAAQAEAQAQAAEPAAEEDYSSEDESYNEVAEWEE